MKIFKGVRTQYSSSTSDSDDSFSVQKKAIKNWFGEKFKTAESVLMIVTIEQWALWSFIVRGSNSVSRIDCGHKSN